MFEELKEEERGEKEEQTKLIRMTAIVVGALVVVAAIVYFATGLGRKAAAPVKPAAAVKQAAPNPVQDLKLVRAVMGRDPSGIRVMWSVQLKNKSDVYTYSAIQYQATFYGPDGGTRGVTRDTINDSIGPGEEKKLTPFIDGIFDAGAANYLFAVTGATAAGR
ncbi:MAG: hypothetical protein LAN62_13250 [Acidobacteriia bacterium]|nr:hypothetical protein [Terriglobia bacterium]